MSKRQESAFVPVLLFLGTVVSIVSSLGAPLIPRIAQEMHESISSAQWALTATLVVAAVFSPLVGRLGDGRHRKMVIVVCLGLVVLGSALAALANTLLPLIIGRALQGFGLALMPLTMASARDHLPKIKAGRAIATLSVVGAAGVGLGYPITGLIADHGGVSAAYWVGTAISALALLLAVLVIPKPSHAPAHQSIDYVGAGIIGVALMALLIALDKGADWGWGSARVPGLIAAGIVLLVVWGWYELRIDHPLVDLRLARHRAVLTANVSGFFLGVTMYVLLVIITQFVQLPGYGLGETVFVAGLTLVPMSIFSASMSRTLPWVVRRVGIRPVIPAGALCVSVAAVFFALTTNALWQTFVTMALIGVGLGYTFAAMPGLIVGAVPPEETGSAMGFYQVSRFVGFAFGSGLAITLLRAFGTANEPTLSSYRAVALVAAALGVITALVAWYLPGKPQAEQSPELEAFEIEEGELAAAGLEDAAPALQPVAAR